MKYTLAIDMCYFSATHLGGKDETILNLLRGFEKNGVSKEILCLCTKEMLPIITQCAPSAHTQIVPQLYFEGPKPKETNRLNYYFRKFFSRYWLIRNKNEVGVFLFPQKVTPNCKFKVPTVVIPHDIQVFEAHELPGVNYSRRAYKKQTSAIKNDFRNRDYIVAISEFDRAEMIRYMPWAKCKIRRIYDPICFDKMGQNTIIGEDYLTVLNIQWEHKNVETVIRAYSLVANQITQSLILVGKLPANMEKLKKLVSELEISDRVIFTGFVGTEELREIVKRTRIYINASYFEGFGMTAVEMMGRRIPTIVAKNTAQPEVTRGLCYYYEPTDNYSALADAIMCELKNPMPTEKLEWISNEMRTHYSYENIAKEYWEFILQCSVGKKCPIGE